MGEDESAGWNEPPWHGNLGRMELRVNARDPVAAMELALDAAPNHSFETLARLGAVQIHAWESAARSPLPMRPETAAEGGGAWTVEVERLGQAQGSRSESFSDYRVTALRFDSPRPHERPLATDDTAWWRAVALAIDEREALGQASDPSPGAKPRKPGL